MKITFKISCKNYLEAANVEELLKKGAVPYEEFLINGSDTASSKRKHFRVTPEIIARVKNTIKMYPNDTDARIKKRLNLEISANSVNRIRNDRFDAKGNRR